MLNSSLIKSLCQISALVYKPNSFFAENYFKKPLPKGCECLSHLNKQPQFIESDIDCQVYVSVFNKNSILCAFRGTENLRDWLTDANMIRVPMDLTTIEDSKRPLAHWGILRQFRSVEDKITKYIDNEIAENKEIKNIVYTGHSLGGGLATIALMNYSHKYPELKHLCVTFGAPRVGNDKFRQMFNEKCCFTKRYVNYFDPVPSLPFSLRYSHTCPSEHINVNIINHVETGITRFFWVMWYKFAHWFGAPYNPIDDHSITGYYDKLCELLVNNDEEEVEVKEVLLVEKNFEEEKNIKL